LPAWCAGAAAMALAWPLLRANFAWVYLVQHAGTFAMLTCVFGHTLFGGRLPMVSRFAAMLHGELPPQLARYTRKVTVVWVGFFLAMTVSSLILFFFGPMEVWSALANLLTPILLGLMFAGEYAVRMAVLPPALRGGLIDSVRVFWRRNEAAPSSPR
ncbi:MAG: hypothetical protein HGA47_13910, partial [Zoogloea sp.]|nr:hypothetical protein [Zoogloea sp.]